ncbi:helix-turn-helix domain-containing protein [Pseudomonas sp. GX19020]|uniref:helix-turn-helix domain-containing protein n=1 Tax=Pseudomonas sp. GX19020 TaxID=2942277 RepID=UPI0020188507|nr:helix-turn-helix transcriptional regulator [Pseudomonas sp. GX19020]MCL4069023.1 helix-turn-helix domain-containing protein [Pseudomonas sp. GX19020]
MELSPFAQRLKVLMEERGIDLRALAEATHTPYHRIYPWFRRPKSKPRSDDIVKISAYFNVSPRFLLEGGERDDLDHRAQVIARVQDLDPVLLGKLEAYIDGLLATAQPKPHD